MGAIYAVGVSVDVDLISVHLDRAGAMNEEVVRFYVAEIAMAVDYLHRKRIVHRYDSPALCALSTAISNPTTFFSTRGATHT